MIKKSRVEILNRLAMFDEVYSKKYLRISQYPKKTYFSVNRLWTFISFSFAYILLIAMIMLSIGEKVFSSVSYKYMFLFFILVVLLYVALLIFYIVITNKKCKKDHYTATMMTRDYYRDIKSLMRDYSNSKKDIIREEELSELKELLGDNQR